MPLTRQGQPYHFHVVGPQRTCKKLDGWYARRRARPTGGVIKIVRHAAAHYAATVACGSSEGVSRTPRRYAFVHAPGGGGARLEHLGMLPAGGVGLKCVRKTMRRWSIRPTKKTLDESESESIHKI